VARPAARPPFDLPNLADAHLPAGGIDRERPDASAAPPAGRSQPRRSSARMRARGSGWDNGLVCTLEAVLVAPSGGAHGGSKAAKVKENLPTRQ
jgi:hypothetical protein